MVYTLKDIKDYIDEHGMYVDCNCNIQAEFVGEDELDILHWDGAGWDEMILLAELDQDLNVHLGDSIMWYQPEGIGIDIESIEDAIAYIMELIRSIYATKIDASILAINNIKDFLNENELRNNPCGTIYGGAY